MNSRQLLQAIGFAILQTTMNKYIEKIAEMRKEAGNPVSVAKALQRTYGSSGMGANKLGELFERKHGATVHNTLPHINKLQPVGDRARAVVQNRNQNLPGVPTVRKGHAALQKNLDTKSPEGSLHSTIANRSMADEVHRVVNGL